MSTELTIRPDQIGFDDTQRAALEALGIDKAPAGDQQLFMHVAQRSGLDPFAKQIYLIPRWDTKSNREKWTIQTSIDGLRVIRDRIGKFQGLTTEWCGPDGIWRDVWLSKDKPAAARVSVYVTGFQVPIRGIALWAEYAQTTKNGSLTAMWNGKSTVMIAKCAEAIAYRQAFPQDFSGLYVAEEMPPTNSVEQDHDGPNVAATMREPAPVKAQPKVAAATTRAHAEVLTEWASRIGEVDDLDALIKLHAEAAERHVLDHRDSKGTSIEDVFLARRETILAAQAQDSAAVDRSEDYADDETLPF